MYRIAIALAAASLALPMSALAQSPRVVGKAGNWTKIEAAGMTAYQTNDNRSGSYIEIGCDEAASLDHTGTGISLEIGGKMLPANSQIRFIVDGETITIPSGKSGGVSTLRCPECAQKFAQLWPLLRQGSRLEVVASDGRQARFSLKGSGQVMPVRPCGSTPDGAPGSSASPAGGELVGLWLGLHGGVGFPLGCDSGEPVRYSSDGTYTGPGATGTWQLEDDRLTEIPKQVDAETGDPAAIGQPFLSRIAWEGQDRFVRIFSDGGRMAFRRCPSTR